MNRDGYDTGLWDHLWIGCHLATMVGDGVGEILGGALAVQDGRIVWVGEESDLPDLPEDCAGTVHRLEGGWITPGLVDCHTHLVFAGDRSGEFEARMKGATYEEIARSGGGIRTTMWATREASEDELYALAVPRLARLCREGVTTVEVKSGYGLELETELTMLRTARRLGELPYVDVQTTLLAAHVVPPEFDHRRAGYVESICREIIPAAVAEGLADAVDGFCDTIAFTPEECRQVLEAGRRAGLPGRLHADQLSDQGGASLAAELQARTADHLERASREGVEAMARSGVVAVLLPGAFYFLREDTPPPVAWFREAGVPMALATDLNPGSSPVNSLLSIVNLACVLFGFTPEEALKGVTTQGAKALGLEADLGTLEKGKKADLAIWEIGHPRELSYWLGSNPCRGIVKEGVPIDSRSSTPPPHRRS